MASCMGLAWSGAVGGGEERGGGRHRAMGSPIRSVQFHVAADDGHGDGLWIPVPSTVAWTIRPVCPRNGGLRPPPHSPPRLNLGETDLDEAGDEVRGRKKRSQ